MARAKLRGSGKMLNCPECGSKKVWKDGFRYVGNMAIQRFLCRVCGYRFSEPSAKVNVRDESGTLESSADLAKTSVSKRNFSFEKSLNDFPFSRCKDVASHGVTDTGKGLNTLRSYDSKCRISVSLAEGTKNLVKVEPQIEKAMWEGTQEIKGQIIGFSFHLKKQGRRETTIRTYSYYVSLILKSGAFINDPETAKLVIANHFKDQNTKRLASYAYDAFLKYLDVPWDRPQYKMEHKQPFIPTEQELQLVLNSGSKENIVYQNLLYETGARKNESLRLEWTDIDSERNKISIKASKNGNARILTVSKRLTEQLLALPKRGEKVFHGKNRKTLETSLNHRMKNLARRLDNPRFRKIHYHTFRHCKALREYHKTKSILHVKKVLGHKSIMTTQRYVELYCEIYGDLKPENYICETAATVKEAKKLVETGFEYVCEIDGEQLFRKVK